MTASIPTPITFLQNPSGMALFAAVFHEHADAVGSLVMPDSDPRRPTAWQKVPHEWFPW